jgi:hypothetical protein
MMSLNLKVLSDDALVQATSRDHTMTTVPVERPMFGRYITVTLPSRHHKWQVSLYTLLNANQHERRPGSGRQ